MKSRLYAALLFLFCLSCAKQKSPVDHLDLSNDNPSESAALRYLKEGLIDSLLEPLDTTYSQKVDVYPSHYERFWFKLQESDPHFIDVALDAEGMVLSATVVRFHRNFTSVETYNGSIELQDLSGKITFRSTITNGFIDREPSSGRVTTNAASTPLTQAAANETLPIVYVYPKAYDWDEAYFWIGYGAGSMNGGVYYPSGSTGGGNGAGYGIYTRNAGGGQPAFRNTANRPTSITVDASYLKPGIDIKTFLNCFSSVPNQGATYSVSLFVDLPVNDDPSQIFNMATGAVGHCFVGLTKTNGTQSVTQYVGFTATQAMSAIVSAGPVAGKIVNNGTHKYNGAVVLSVNAAQFNTACNTADALSKSTYDIVNFNCVSFGLSVVNSMHAIAPIVPTPISNSSSQLFSMPEGLYKTMQQMQASGKPAVTGGVWNAGQSHGSCN